jgi:hypothetical protein
VNHPWLRWLLDVDSIPPDAEGVVLGWEHPWPAWVWVLIVVAALVLAWVTYFPVEGRRSVRAMLAAVRGFALLAIAVLISGPVLEMPQERTEQDWVLILADRSASLSVADVGSGGARISRDEQMATSLRDHADLFKELARTRQLVWLGFHQGAFDLRFDPETGVVDLGDATGWRTSLSTALEQALQRAAARPLSGVVLFSDGRTSDAPTRALVRRLQSEDVRVSVAPLGSSEPTGDLAVRRIEAPQRAFVRDRVPVSVELDRVGNAVARDGMVRLVDTSTGRELDSVALSEVDDRGHVTLSGEPTSAGQATWQVVVDAGDRDLVPENNAQLVTVELIDRPLRVLYIEGYPRWEYRYFKNLLVREESIESSVMLLSADRDFAQEGNAPITRLPRTAEEFAAYDVIALGDVPATFFPAEQLALIRDQVALRGAGLLWIGGPRSTPSTYAGSELADLLPMRGDLELESVPMPVNMTPTPLAQRLGVLQMASGARAGWPHELEDPSQGWSSFQWAQHIASSSLKPTTEVLARTVQSIDGEPAPLIMHLRFGAGRVLYLATDEIWRWRYGRGELLPEQFWLQMVRMLGRESLSGGEAVLLEVEPRRVEVGQPAQLRLRVLDARLADPSVTRMGGSVVSTRGEAADIELQRASESGPAEFITTFISEAAGTFTVRLDDPALGGLRPEATLVVERPDDEMRRPETDHPLLATLAAETGGRVLSPDDLSALRDPQVLPNRSITTMTGIRERIWNTPLALIVVVVLLTLEWVGRKLIRLV